MPNWPMALAIVAVPAVAHAGSYSSHDVHATFVSADAKASTFTIALDDGSNNTGRAEGSASAILAKLKPGDRISVTCRNDANGRYLSATAIHVVK